MDAVKVFLRIKQTEEEGAYLNIAENSVEIAESAYEFDRVFQGPDQETVFYEVSNMLSSVKDTEESLTIFAYGQTGSGKTFTMEGTKDLPGLVPRFLRQVFLDASSISLSMIEVYNEKITDILKDHSEKAEAASELTCRTAEEAERVFKHAIQRRRTEDNGVNERSSRSHLIIKIQIKTAVSSEESEERVRQRITLVDLAGSERLTTDQTKIKRRKKERDAETGSINKSLLCLRRAFKALSTKKQHINYRDSKLTYILKEVLTEKTRLAIIGTVNPDNPTETISTIKFINLAKKIRLRDSTGPSLQKHTPGTTDPTATFMVPSGSAPDTDAVADTDRYHDGFFDTAIHIGAANPEQNHIRPIAASNIDGEIDSVLVRIEELNRKVAKMSQAFSHAKNASNAAQHRLFISLAGARREEIENLEVPEATKR